MNSRFFRPYRARFVFSIYGATNLLPLRGTEILPFYLEIGYWLLVIDLKNKLSPDSPHALCPLLLAYATDRPCRCGTPSLPALCFLPLPNCFQAICLPCVLRNPGVHDVFHLRLLSVFYPGVSAMMFLTEKRDEGTQG